MSYQSLREMAGLNAHEEASYLRFPANASKTLILKYRPIQVNTSCSQFFQCYYIHSLHISHKSSAGWLLIAIVFPSFGQAEDPACRFIPVWTRIMKLRVSLTRFRPANYIAYNGSRRARFAGFATFTLREVAPWLPRRRSSGLYPASSLASGQAAALDFGQ